MSTLIVDEKHSVSQMLGSSKATGTPALKVVGILVAPKATVDKNVNSYCWQDLGSSLSYSRQECQSHFWQDFGSSEKLRRQLRQLTGSVVSSRLLVAVIATGTSALKVVGILVAPKATVDRNVNSHCWQDFGSSESYSRQECQLPLLTRFW